MAPPVPRRPAPGSSRWHWLLLIPVVVPLLVFLYNGKDPYLFGFPRFYWLQFTFIALGVGTTALVYQLTKKRGCPALSAHLTEIITATVIFLIVNAMGFVAARWRL